MRWVSSGEPGAWVWKHVKGWSHPHWLGLLTALRRQSEYWPMDEAAVGTHLEALKRDLSQFAPPHLDGKMPLHVAAEKGRRDVAELLLACRADVNAKDTYGNTPLHVAAGKGHPVVAELLLANGADVNAKNMYGATPLHVAAEKGHTDLAAMLLANKADVNASASKIRTPIRRPLGLAIHYGRKDVARLLRQHGGKVGLWEQIYRVIELASERVGSGAELVSMSASKIVKMARAHMPQQTPPAGPSAARAQQITSPSPSAAIQENPTASDAGTIVIAEESVVEEIVVVAATRTRRRRLIGFKK